MFLFICFAMVFLIVPAAAVAADALPPVAVQDPDPAVDRMCPESADPDAAPEKRLIHCGLEYGKFAPDPPPAPRDDAPGRIVIAAYNMERGFELDDQIRLFQIHPQMKHADILLISEADRGCSRTDRRNVTRELAKALGMDYVYGVEFMELFLGEKSDSGNDIREICEHGNAVLSRHPLVRAEEIRHVQSASWYQPPGDRHRGQPRLGGRMAVMADVDIRGTVVRVYSVHFDSGMDDDPNRASQARQLVAHAADAPGPVVIGGDMNTAFYVMDLSTGSSKDPTVPVFLESGYEDAHAPLKHMKRGTTRNEFGVRAVIDLIMVRGAEVTDRGICPGKKCDRLSDHLPIWAELRLPE